MVSSIALFAVASAATFASALQTASIGGASIVNYCDADITMTNVPAATPGSNYPPQVTKVLKAGNVGADSQYFQNYISLDVAGGWSMKLSDPKNASNMAQFEYTWTGDSSLWYDMSFVSYCGPCYEPWSFSCSNSEVTPSNLYYKFATDDKAGMQSGIAVTDTVTLNLCPASATPSGGAIASTTATATSDATTAEATSAPAYTASSSSTVVPSSTTFTTRAFTSTTSTESAEQTKPIKNHQNSFTAHSVLVEDDKGVEIVTMFATEVVTAVVTETAHAKRRRHEHKHPHGPHH